MPQRATGARPPRTSIGLSPDCAWARAVTALVTPGPAVTAATPHSRVTLAHPSAAKAADCSWRTSTMRRPCSVAPVRMGQMWPPFKVNRWLVPARFSASAMSSPVLPESANALGPRHGGRVESGLRLAVAADQDDAAAGIHRAPQPLDGLRRHLRRVHAVLELDDRHPAEAETDEGLAHSCSADRAVPVVGVETCAGDRRIADAPGQLAGAATRRHGHRHVAA